jgi:group I intron endonuclease
MKKAGVVYKITNTITEKAYIGVTTKDNPYKRINDHFRKSNSKNSIISKSIKKHGKENFKVEILLTCFDLDYLSDMGKIFYRKVKHNTAKWI